MNMSIVKSNKGSKLTILSVLKEIEDQLQIDDKEPVSLESWYKRNDGLEYKLKRILIKLESEKAIDGLKQVKIKDGSKKGGYRYKWSFIAGKDFKEVLKKQKSLISTEQRYEQTLKEITKQKSKPSNLDIKYKQILSGIEKDKSVVKQSPDSAKDNRQVFVCGNLRVDIDEGVVNYKNNRPVEVEPNNKNIKFLTLLIKSKGIVEYEQIAKELKMDCWHEGVINRDVARDVQFLRRDLVVFLRDKVGFTKREIRNMIVNKKNIGYKVSCTKAH